MARITIKIINLNKSYSINERFTKNLVKAILRILKRSKGCELEIVFLDDKSIRQLNKRFKGSDRPTDVLSFAIDRKEFGQKALLGEVFISLDRARQNSRIFKTNFTDEVVLYIIHGILHLSGYDDEDKPDRVRMSEKEAKILEYLCTKENLSKVLTPQ